MLPCLAYHTPYSPCPQPNVKLREPEVTVSVFAELVRREALPSALAGRDDKDLVRILKFLQK